MFKNYFKIAVRNLARNKVYSFINIAGLSLGLACAMLIILYTKDEQSYDQFHEKKERIYRIVNCEINEEGSTTNCGGHSGYFQGPRFAAGVPEISAFLRYQDNYLDIRQGTEVVSQNIHVTDSNFFSVFTFPFLAGDPASALKNPRSIVISEDFAEKQFGEKDALNKTIMIKDGENFEPFTVTGVTRKCPQNSSIKFEALIPMQVESEVEAVNENWFNFFLNSFVVLEESANISEVENKMQQVYISDAAESIVIMKEKYGIATSTSYKLQPLSDLHLSETYSADNGLVEASNPVYSYILSGIALFILLIACFNFINLTIARSVKRAKEIGIRKVVGGAKKQLITQFMGESLLISFAAFLIAIVVVQLALPTFNQLSNKALSLSYLFDINLILLYSGLFLVTGFLAGLYPSLIISNYNPVKALYSRFKLGSKNYLQKSLVVLQFAMATLLIIATFSIYTQFDYLTNKDLGYDDSNIILVEKSGLSRQEAKLFKEELLSNPNVEKVSSKNGGGWATIAKINGETETHFDYETVDENYLSIYEIPIVNGRNFSSEFSADSTQSILVNEAFVRKAGWENPIGEVVDFWYRENEKYTVVGVVKDHHHKPLSQEISPQVFTMKPDNPLGMAIIKIKPGSESESLKHIESTFKKLFPISPFSYEFKEESNLRNYESEAKWKQMMLFGAFLTIFISGIGLFGLSVLAAESRVKEIGIRKVLGASVSGVVTILSADFIKLVMLALLMAMPVAWILINKWLEKYPYRIDIGWQIFTVAGLTVLAIALLTVSFQSIRAAIANPVNSLRSE
jgi:putative ABC transport system permease protein